MIYIYVAYCWRYLWLRLVSSVLGYYYLVLLLWDLDFDAVYLYFVEQIVYLSLLQFRLIVCVVDLLNIYAHRDCLRLLLGEWFPHLEIFV